MRAAIDVHHGGVFLRGVEACGLHHAVVEVGCAVGSLDGADGDFGHVVALPRVVGGEEALCLAAAGIDEVDGTGDVGCAPCVDEELAAVAEAGVVHAASLAQQRALAVLERDGPHGALEGRCLAARDDDGLAALVEADDALVNPAAGGDLLHKFAAGVVEVEVVEAVALAEVEEEAAVPRQEGEGVLGLDVLLVALLEQHAFTLARGGVVAHQLGMVLVAVQLNDIDLRALGVPADVCQVAVGGVARLEPDGLACCGIEDAHGDDVARHAGHGVFVGHDGGDAGRKVGLRIVGDHALVHAVEGQQAAAGVPEGAALDAEFVAVDGLSADDALRLVGDGDLVAVGGANEEVVLLGEGRVAGRLPLRPLVAVVLCQLDGLVAVEDERAALGPQLAVGIPAGDKVFQREGPQGCLLGKEGVGAQHGKDDERQFLTKRRMMFSHAFHILFIFSFFYCF